MQCLKERNERKIQAPLGFAKLFEKSVHILKLWGSVRHAMINVLQSGMVIAAMCLKSWEKWDDNWCNFSIVMGYGNNFKKISVHNDVTRPWSRWNRSVIMQCWRAWLIVWITQIVYSRFNVARRSREPNLCYVAIFLWKGSRTRSINIGKTDKPK